MPLNTASEAKLKGVKADLAKVARRAAELSARPFQIVSGTRTQAQQNALYAQGRTKPGSIVTWTKNSKHIGGNAVDFAALVAGKISWNEKYYPAIGKAFSDAARELGIGIERGMDWATKDWGHIQLTGKATSPVPVSTRPQPAPPGLGDPLLKRGSKGIPVLDAQRLLAKHGHAAVADQKFGPATEKAVKAFQTAKGLKADGKVGAVTWAALRREPGEAPPPPPVPTDPNDNASKAMAYFIGQGWTPAQAAGIVSNLQQESYADLRFNVWGDGGKSYGIAQWLGPRLAALKAMPGFDTLEGQLGFITYEFDTTEKKARDLLRKAVTVEEATAAFIGFERPQGFTWASPKKGHGWSNRLAYAQALYAKHQAAASAAMRTLLIPEERKTEMAVQKTTTVDVIPWYESKINWVSIIGVAAQVGNFVGLFSIDADTQLQIAAGLGALQGFLTGVLKTWTKARAVTSQPT